MKLLKSCRQRFQVLSVAGVLVCHIDTVRCATVTSAADDNGPTTLRNLVNIAPNGGVIDFNLPVGSVINLTQGEMLLNKDLTISGPGAMNLTINAANSHDRAFEVHKNGNTGVTVSVNRLRFTGGYAGADGASGNAGNRQGQDGSPAEGGIFLNDNGCVLVLTNCWFDSCYATGGSGGVGFGGDLAQPGKGGNGGPALGGAVSTAGMLVISGCTFSGDIATGGRGGDGTNASSSFSGSDGGAGAWAEGGALYVDYNGAPALLATNCTFFENLAHGGDGGTGGSALLGPAGGNGGGGSYALGGGMYYVNNMCAQNDCGTMDHCTFNQNYTWPGSGGAAGVGPVSGNPGPNGIGGGGGIFLNVPNFQVWNTLVAGNGGLGASLCPGPDINGTIISLSHNLVGVDDGQPMGLTPLDLQGAPGTPIDPHLGPLQDNGGETPTLAPLAGSPAIDGGTDGNAPTDQAGLPRPVVVTGGPFNGDGGDIGAFELQCSPDVPALSIQQTGAALVLTWPWPSLCFVLQQSPDLLNWTDSIVAVAHVGNQNQVVINPPPPGNLFFRLKK